MTNTSSHSGSLYIASLDGIRAVSFMAVFLSHAGLKVVPGGFGVTVFFFLSGYLIASLLRLELERRQSISFKNFYLRRALRILPPFYLVLLGAVLLSLQGFLPGNLEALPVLAQAGHFTNYWQLFHGNAGQPAGTGVYWSLAVEEHFYLIFPALYWILARSMTSRAHRAAVLLGLCAVVMLWRCYLVFGLNAPTDRTYVCTDTRFDSLLFGCALATYGNPALDAPGRISANTWKFVLLPLGFAALLFSFSFRNPAFRESVRYTIQGLALIPIFVVAVREPNWGPMKLLNLRWVKFTGVLSYSLYLLHQVILMAMEHRTTLPALPRAIVALTIAMAIALAIHRFVEEPCAKLRKILAATRQSRPASPSAAVEEQTAHTTAIHAETAGS